MCGLEICAEKNSSAAKQAALPARTRIAGKAPWSSVSAGESSVLSASSRSAILDKYNILYRILRQASDSLILCDGRALFIPFCPHPVSPLPTINYIH